LLEQFNNLSDLTAEAIMAAKSFSALIDRDLEARLLEMIEKRFSEEYNKTDEQIQRKNYNNETAENLKILSNLTKFSTHFAH
jgi:hemerythrin-like domain-containing protein